MTNPGGRVPAPTSTAEQACLEAWRQWCDRLKETGEGIAAAGHPDPAEGMRHLTRLAVHALQSSIEYADTDHPVFHRYDDDVTKWGGPNVDNIYLRARVDPTHTYRLTGNVTGLRQLLLSLVEGDMQLEQYGVFAEVDLAALHPAPDGRFELRIGPDEQPGTGMRMDPRTRYVSIRQYFSDWEKDLPGDFRLERVGAEGLAPPRLDSRRMAGMLTEATEWVTRSLPYWAAFMEDNRTRLGTNTLSEPRSVEGGAHNIRYGGGIWELGPDQALVMETDVPDADYWSVQLYTMPWFESLDIANRQNSLTGHLARTDPDGRVRFVVAHHDPGHANWLDTEGRTTGMVSWRWIWARSAPTPRATVVPFADLDAHLPADTTRVDPDGRRRDIARRQAHIARRFRR